MTKNMALAHAKLVSMGLRPRWDGSVILDDDVSGGTVELTPEYLIARCPGETRGLSFLLTPVDASRSVREALEYIRSEGEPTGCRCPGCGVAVGPLGGCSCGQC